MVYNMLGLNNDPKIPTEPTKEVPPPKPLVRLLLAFIFAVIGPVIIWVAWQLYQLHILGFFS
jgi:hypothetical protein